MRSHRILGLAAVLVLGACSSTEKKDDTGTVTSTDFGLPYETPGLNGTVTGTATDLAGVTGGALKSVTLIERGPDFVMVQFECPDGTKPEPVRVDIPPAPVAPGKTSQGPYVDTGCKKNGKPVRINVTRNR